MKEQIIKARKNKKRIRTIFIALRKKKIYEGWSDLILLNTIVELLIDHGLRYGKLEIYSAFKLIDKEDYCKKLERKLMKHLLRKGRDKSIFPK